MINAQTTAGANMTYIAPATPTYPVIDTRGFNDFDSNTGSMTVIPQGTQVAVITILVQEFRNGVLIGSTMRDIQVVVQVCANFQPVDNGGGIFNQVGGVNVDANSIEVCLGEAFSFDIRYDDANLFDNITLVTNLATVIPGATFTTSGSNPITGSFSWTSTSADVGFHNFTVTVQDDGCPILGSQVFAFDILVQDRTLAGVDQTVCPGGISVDLNAIGGTVFNWTYLSSGLSVSAPDLSCNNCANPTANPVSTETYVVTSNLRDLCKNKDTVVVNVTAGFTLNMPSDQTICLNEAINLPITTSAGTYTYDWTPSIGLNNPTIANPFANPIATTTYLAVVTNTGTGCVIQDVVDVTISGEGPLIDIINDTSICAGDPVLLSTSISPSCDYSISGIAYSLEGGGSWTSIAGLTSNSGIDDNTESGVPIGFNFEFYCNTYSDLFVTSNAIVAFGTSPSSTAYSQTLPNATNPDNAIFVAADDLESVNVRYKTIGTAPNRVFVLDWEGTHYPENNGETIDFQLKLYEGSNNIEVHYATIEEDVGSTNGMTAGIENIDGTDAVTILNNTKLGAYPLTNTAYRYSYPQSIGPYTYTWTGGLPSVSGPTVTPGASTSYVVNVLDAGVGCIGTAIVNIQVGAAFSINSTGGATICYGDNTPLTTTPSGGGIYTYDWTPNTSLIGNFTSMPTASPTVNTTYSVSVDNGGCVRTDNVVVNVAGSPVNASIDSDSICPGDIIQLDVGMLPNSCGPTTACAGSSTIYTVGTGVSQTNTSIYKGFYTDSRMQILYTAADLTALGLTPGTITAIAFNVAFNGSSLSYDDFTISMAGVSASSLSDFLPGVTAVYGPVNYTVSSTGWQTHTFATPFTWDGTCDLLVQTCFNNSNSSNSDAIFYTPTSYNSVIFDAESDSDDGCSLTSVNILVNRPDTRFTMCTTSLPAGAIFSWTGTVSNSGIQSPTSTPAVSGTYDVTVVNPAFPACTSTSQVRVGINTESVTASTDNTNACTGDFANLSTSLSTPIPPICDSYIVSSIGHVWNSSGTGWTEGAATMTGDGGYLSSSEGMAIGFDFDFYCNTYTEAFASANGFMSFVALASSSGYSSAIPSATTANNQIAFATEDLVCTASRYRTDGVVPNRVFTFQYAGNHYNVATEQVRVQILLYETSNIIDIQIKDVDDDASIAATMTMGIENSDGTIGVTVPGRNNQNWTATDEGWRFTPDAGATYSWSPAIGLDDQTSAFPIYTTPDNATRDFVVTVTGGYCDRYDTVTIGCLLANENVEFSAQSTMDKIKLKWRTFGLKKATYFEILRSKNGENKFLTIGKVSANTGNGFLDYNFDDLKPNTGDNYYKIKIINEDNSYTYSSLIKVNFNDENSVKVYPNPFTHSKSFFIDFETEGNYIEVEIVDLVGRVVENKLFDVEKGINTLKYNSINLSVGTYIYKIKTIEGEAIGKIIMND